MKCFHVHLSVVDLQKSIEFYSTLFAAEPSVRKDDYAKWALEDPKVNFAISDRSHTTGVDHLGIQVEEGQELVEIAARLKAAGATTHDEAAATCCYATSDKAWVTDPSGVQWETFYTFGEAAVYGEDNRGELPKPAAQSCCSPNSGRPAAACC